MPIRGSRGRTPGASASVIDDFADEDADGQLDLLTRSAFHGVRVSGSGCDLQACAAADAPRLLMHGRPDGTFSFEDPASRDHARRLCPAKPKKIFAPKDKGSQINDGIRNLVCALMWGAKPSDLTAEVARARASMCKDPDSCPTFTAIEDALSSATLALPALAP